MLTGNCVEELFESGGRVGSAGGGDSKMQRLQDWKIEEVGSLKSEHEAFTRPDMRDARRRR